MRLVPNGFATLMAALPLLVALAACATGSASTKESEGDRTMLADADADADGADGVGVRFVSPGTPCYGAVHGDPRELAALSPAPVYLPSDGAARVTEAWRCGSTPVFLFDDVQVSFESGWQNVRIPEKFEDLARDYGGSVETIQGLSAWVAPSSTDASNDEVLIVKDDAAIKLLAPGNVPIADLVSVASSLDLGTPIGRYPGARTTSHRHASTGPDSGMRGRPTQRERSTKSHPMAGRHHECCVGYDPSFVHWPSDTTSTAPSTTLMADCSSMA